MTTRSRFLATLLLPFTATCLQAQQRPQLSPDVEEQRVREDEIREDESGVARQQPSLNAPELSSRREWAEQRQRILRVLRDQGPRPRRDAATEAPRIDWDQVRQPDRQPPHPGSAHDPDAAPPPRRHDIGPPHEIERRLDHLHQAMKHLHEAGFPEAAERLVEQVERFEREIHEHHERRRHEAEAAEHRARQEGHRALDDVRGQLTRLRYTVQELQREVADLRDRMSEESAPARSDDDHSYGDRPAWD